MNKEFRDGNKENIQITWRPHWEQPTTLTTTANVTITNLKINEDFIQTNWKRKAKNNIYLFIHEIVFVQKKKMKKKNQVFIALL